MSSSKVGLVKPVSKVSSKSSVSEGEYMKNRINKRYKVENQADIEKVKQEKTVKAEKAK